MILLLGGSGYVGSAFREELERRGIAYRSISRSRVNYTQRENLSNLVSETKPTFLINCAGYTGKPNVDACEIHKSECLDGNAVLPGTIREVCEHHNLKWGHVSSGCIFTGRRSDGGGFTEADSPNFCFRTNNCSWYSGCKALGEEVLVDCQDCYIWRLRIPFNNQNSSRNYISKILNYSRLLDAENSISHLNDFTQACLDCWELRIPFGIYNVTNTGSVTTRRVVELLREKLNIERPFSFFESEREFMQIAAKTPRSNCVMDNSKIRNAGVRIRDVEEALQDSLTTWNDNTSV